MGALPGAGLPFVQQYPLYPVEQLLGDERFVPTSTAGACGITCWSSPGTR